MLVVGEYHIPNCAFGKVIVSVKRYGTNSPVVIQNTMKTGTALYGRFMNLWLCSDYVMMTITEVTYLPV